MNELQQLQELLDTLIDQTMVAMQGATPMSDQLQGLVADQLAWLVGRIEQLSTQAPVEGLPPQPPEEPEMGTTMPSSNIHSFGYDQDTGRLLVKFQGDYPEENGPVYAYEGVPEGIFDIFRNGAVPAKTSGKNKWGQWWKGKMPSLGAAMYAAIKQGGYQYQRLR